MATATVTLIAPDGRLDPATVEAKSLCAAIFRYHSMAHDESGGLPQPDRSSVFEVQPDGGPIRRVTFAAVPHGRTALRSRGRGKRKPMANLEHLAKLLEGVEKWNLWRANNPGVACRSQCSGSSWGESNVAARRGQGKGRP